MDWQQILALIVMILGTAALVASVALLARTQPRQPEVSTRLKPAVGTVVDFENRGEPDAEIWHPVVEFRTADGRVVQGSTDWGANPMPFLQGSSIPVRYDPDEPERVIHYAGKRPEVDRDVAGGAKLLLGLGAGLFVAGLAVYLLRVYGG